MHNTQSAHNRVPTPEWIEYRFHVLRVLLLADGPSSYLIAALFGLTIAWVFYKSPVWDFTQPQQQDVPQSEWRRSSNNDQLHSIAVRPLLQPLRKLEPM